MNTQFIKRLKSLAWRSAMMGLAAFTAAVLENLDMLELSPTYTMLLGLVLGEISKHLNTKSV